MLYRKLCLWGGENENERYEDRFGTTYDKAMALYLWKGQEWACDDLSTSRERRIWERDAPRLTAANVRSGKTKTACLGNVCGLPTFYQHMVTGAWLWSNRAR